jgi:hypothetical protein
MKTMAVNEEIFVLTDEQKEVIRDFGALGYSIKKMQTILNHSDPEFVHGQMSDQNSEFYKNYHLGKETYEFDLNVKLLEMARSGDLMAMKRLNAIKETEQYNFPQ